MSYPKRLRDLTQCRHLGQVILKCLLNGHLKHAAARALEFQHICDLNLGLHVLAQQPVAGFGEACLDLQLPIDSEKSTFHVVNNRADRRRSLGYHGFDFLQMLAQNLIQVPNLVL